MTGKPKKLTDRQSLFLSGILGGAVFNATEAARRAGYAWPDKQGSVLARHPKIAPLIEAELRRRTPVYTKILAELREKQALAWDRKRRRGKI